MGCVMILMLGNSIVNLRSQIMQAKVKLCGNPYPMYYDTVKIDLPVAINNSEERFCRRFYDTL